MFSYIREITYVQLHLEYKIWSTNMCVCFDITGRILFLFSLFLSLFFFSLSLFLLSPSFVHVHMYFKFYNPDRDINNFSYIKKHATDYNYGQYTTISNFWKKRFSQSK